MNLTNRRVFDSLKNARGKRLTAAAAVTEGFPAQAIVVNTTSKLNSKQSQREVGYPNHFPTPWFPTRPTLDAPLFVA